ncbi:DUF4041 domain-containing protein [Chitinophaga sp. sic0106]|uniref:DUF4041 domain-containing protein n=1 Tax=Chitinophaga sp. sic0106 TaxID=2854785 RepID=UPI001C48B73D|nr:DUF4041 domain-containing protein [Chitinophaga sp. sic0106]MBV7529794.1 DUF4041 domain-containing protein [Chitinophaga sp. sic0106]
MFFNKSKKLLLETELKLASALTKIHSYENEFKDVIDKNVLLEEKAALLDTAQDKLKKLNEKYQVGLELHKALQAELSLYQDNLEIGSYGLHKPQHSFDTSENFKHALDINFDQQKKLIKDDKAVVCTMEWTVGGSKVEGRKMTNQYKKLMLLAFNGESDGLVAKVKWNNAVKTRERIIKAFETINKLGVTHNVFITNEFLTLKLEELSLTYEYEKKKYDEKEEQRMIREQMREEEKAQRELEKAQKEAEDEERRYQKALEKAQKDLQGASTANAVELAEQVKLLEARLKDAHERKERAIAQAQLTKVGHIYVISNLGSFGDGIYKIGMTRRLDPMDRVKELGDASVPFQFDVHAIIYSENAPQLEYELHRKFADRRLNRINTKKEFFKVSLSEIEAFVQEHANAEIEFTQLAEAKEYRETLSILAKVEKAVNMIEQVEVFPGSLI